MAMVTTKKQYEFCDELWGLIMSYVGVTEYTSYGSFNGNVIIDINYLRTEGEYGIFKNSYKLFNRTTGEVTSCKYHQSRKEDALVKYKLVETINSYMEQGARKSVVNDIQELTFSPMMSKINKQVKEKVRIKLVQKLNKRNTNNKLVEDILYVNGETSTRNHIITNYKRQYQIRHCVNIKTGEIRRDTRVIRQPYSMVTFIDAGSKKYQFGTRIINL